MKRKGTVLLFILTAVFGAFCGGFFLGRNLTSSPVQVTYVQASTVQTTPTEPTFETEEINPVTFPININSAKQEELMALPGIGEVLSQRIIDYRENSGPFSSVMDLLNVEGIGEHRMEELLPYVTIGG